MRGTRRPVLRLLVLALALSPAVVATAPAHAIEGLQVEGTTTYRLDPGDGRVRVTVRARLVNTLPSQTVGAYVRTPYFDTFAVPALGPVKNATATSTSGGKLSVDIEERAGVTVVVADLSPNLVHGSPQTVTFQYDLPGQPPRSKTITRVNNGYAGWSVFGTGDAGKIDIVIDVPSAYEVSLSKAVDVRSSRRGNRQLYRMDGIRNPDDAFLFASAGADARLSTRTLTVGETDVTIKAWPGDSRWRRFATRWVRRGLPAIADIIGLKVPEDELSVVESSRAYQIGFAGFYVPVLGIVEVGDELDEATVLHELTHAWFNSDMFADRWVSEGLAEEVANRALAQLGKKRTTPKRIDRGDRGAVKLAAWQELQPLDRSTAATEKFAYNASYRVVHEITTDIGIDGLRKVLAAASERHLAYQGDPAPEEFDGVRDWRYFYDLVELVGGATTAEDLFTEHVLLLNQALPLRERAQARGELDELAAAGNGWTPPLEVRQALANWEFGSAKRAMRQARGLLGRSRAAADQLTAAGITAAPGKLESAYEGAGALTELGATVEEYEAIAQDATTVRQRADAASPLAKLGLLGADLGFDDADTAVADGKLDEVPEILSTASATVDAAATRGAWILTALVLLAGMIVFLVLHRRATRREPASVVTTGPPSAPGDLDSAVPVQETVDRDDAPPAAHL